MAYVMTAARKAAQKKAALASAAKRRGKGKGNRPLSAARVQAKKASMRQGMAASGSKSKKASRTKAILNYYRKTGRPMPLGRKKR